MEALIMYIILVLTTSPLALIVNNQISFVNMMKDNKDQMYSKQKTWLETCFTLTAKGKLLSKTVEHIYARWKTGSSEDVILRMCRVSAHWKQIGMRIKLLGDMKMLG